MAWDLFDLGSLAVRGVAPYGNPDQWLKGGVNTRCATWRDGRT